MLVETKFVLFFSLFGNAESYAILTVLRMKPRNHFVCVYLAKVFETLQLPV